MRGGRLQPRGQDAASARTASAPGRRTPNAGEAPPETDDGPRGLLAGVGAPPLTVEARLRGLLSDLDHVYPLIIRSPGRHRAGSRSETPETPGTRARCPRSGGLEVLVIMVVHHGRRHPPHPDGVPCRRGRKVVPSAGSSRPRHRPHPGSPPSPCTVGPPRRTVWQRHGGSGPAAPGPVGPPSAGPPAAAASGGQAMRSSAAGPASPSRRSRAALWPDGRWPGPSRSPDLRDPGTGRARRRAPGPARPGSPARLGPSGPRRPHHGPTNSQPRVTVSPSNGSFGAALAIGEPEYAHFSLTGNLPICPHGLNVDGERILRPGRPTPRRRPWITALRR